MKTFWTIPFCCAVLMACRSDKNSRSGTSEGPKGSDTATTNFVANPSIDLIGRISSINSKSRFVVLAYPTTRVPDTEQKLNVYREGRKVGELRVTGPRQENLTAADILAGEVYVGDEVRIN